MKSSTLRHKAILLFCIVKGRIYSYRFYVSSKVWKKAWQAMVFANTEKSFCENVLYHKV